MYIQTLFSASPLPSLETFSGALQFSPIILILIISFSVDRIAQVNIDNFNSLFQTLKRQGHWSKYLIFQYLYDNT